MRYDNENYTLVINDSCIYLEGDNFLEKIIKTSIGKFGIDSDVEYYTKIHTLKIDKYVSNILVNF